MQHLCFYMGLPIKQREWFVGRTDEWQVGWENVQTPVKTGVVIGKMLCNNKRLLHRVSLSIRL